MMRILVFTNGVKVAHDTPYSLHLTGIKQAFFIDTTNFYLWLDL